MLACAVGFIGPFGTYVRERLSDRVGVWWLLLMGAYLLVRPAMILLRRLAKATDLSSDMVVFWGVSLCSIPVAWIWRSVGRHAFRELEGFATLLPFSLLSVLGVFAVVRWAESADRRLRRHGHKPASSPDIPDEAVSVAPIGADRKDNPASPEASPGPALLKRLPPSFGAPILGLQSEDHYVRVHGRKDSTLLLLRLREAVAEMSGVEGEQVHRSWWIARSGVATTEKAGRSWNIRLKNGVVAPVARESVERLRRSGFLPTDRENSG